ncbi:MAG: aminotransferase class IV [Actinobacteria bacterium]|nr:aminotransferase class IV [Actinomycetota bacterium]
MFGYTYINGRFFLPGRAKIQVSDRGFTYGDGIFETMRSYSGNVFMFSRHLERLFRSMRELRYNYSFDADHIRKAVEMTLEKNRLLRSDAYIKIMVTRGEHRGDFSFSGRFRPSVIIVAKKPELPSHVSYLGGVDLVSSTITRSSLGNPVYVHKLINYFENLYAKNEAYLKGAYEAMFLTRDKLVLEGAATNIFIAGRRTVYTPPITQNILPGVTRSTVIKLCRDNGIRVREKKLHYRDLVEAAEVFLTNSIIEILPVKKIDVHYVKKPVPGDLTSSLIDLYGSAVLKMLSD